VRRLDLVSLEELKKLATGSVKTVRAKRILGAYRRMVAYVMALRICMARDEGNKQVQAGTGMPKLINSEELRRQRMPSPSKFHHVPRTSERHRVFSQC
jgi:hypothetical protein